MASFEQAYAPQSIDEVVFSDEKTKSVLKEHLKSDPTRPLLLHGLHGNGKTTIAKLSAEVLQPGIHPYDELWLDADGMHDYRKKLSEIEGIAGSLAISSQKKVVIMDEFDNYSLEFQRTLKGVINRHQNNVHFIFTTNHINRIDEGILSRSLMVPVEVPKPSRWVQKFKDICLLEGVSPPTDGKIVKLLSLCASGREVMARIESFVKHVQAKTHN